MAENPDHYEEKWVAVVGDNEYHLNKAQAKIVQETVAVGRGIVQFKDFIINIPFLKEFYLEKRWLKPEYQLPVEERITLPERTASAPRTEQQQAQWEDHKRLLIARSKAVARNILPPKELAKIKRMSAKEFKDRKQFLLEQAKNL